jgi:peptide/nickel transport system substrate-binding protein
MKRLTRWGVLAAAVGALAVVGAGCGSSSDDNASSTTSTTNIEGKKGGKLTYLAAADIDYLDPGQTYYTFGFMVAFATQRQLLNYMPNDSTKAIPDLASEMPVISDDSKTITFKIRSGIKYAPPVNREVKTADIKYAIERAFSKNVPNGYAGTYFNSIEGAPESGTGPIKDISGITTPDDTTLVIKLTKPLAPMVVQALGLPISTPVPKEYAAPFDAKLPSTYDQHVAFSGPYMVKSDASGLNVGRVPGKSITIVRNPNWDAATDYRPAYVDEVTIQEGNNDLASASRRTLTGKGLLCCDAGAPPAEVLKEALEQYKDQVIFIPSGGTRYIAFNTTIPPFDNANIRKAIIAGTDRNALRLTRGGAVLGDIANGWIPPGIPGFDESGGLNQNTDLDFLKSPTGDPAVVRKYMDAAQADGLPVKDGKWVGTDTILTIASNADPGKKTAESFQQQIENLGFKLNFRIVPQDTLYTKFCGVPSAKVAICPNVGWFKDFSDPQAMLDATFNGNNILQQGNVNWPQLNVPAINDAMDKAAPLAIGPERNKAWAEINHMIAEQAPAIPWIWDKTAIVNSSDVLAVGNDFNTTHDLSFTSLK